MQAMNVEDALSTARETIDALSQAIDHIPQTITLEFPATDNGAPSIGDRIARALEAIADSLVSIERRR